MRAIILSGIFYLPLFSQSVQPSSAEQQFKQLEWLIGKWQRQNVRSGRTAFESWEKSNTFKLSGLGISMKGSDTTFVEKLSIEIIDNQLVYVALPQQNNNPTYFKITSLNKTGFISENPDHDFPKKISYQLNNGLLTAQISGNGKAIDFLFKRYL